MRLGYTIIYVADVPDTIAFYEKAFGVQRRFVVEDGTYGELDTGAVTLSFADQEFAKESFGFDFRANGAGSVAPGFEVGFVTDDVETAFHAAVAAGAKPLVEPKQKPWGQTVAYVRDLNGILVEICTPIAANS
jgi:lactoylglutathione lyase